MGLNVLKMTRLQITTNTNQLNIIQSTDTSTFGILLIYLCHQTNHRCRQVTQHVKLQLSDIQAENLYRINIRNHRAHTQLQ